MIIQIRVPQYIITHIEDAPWCSLRIHDYVISSISYLGIRSEEKPPVYLQLHIDKQKTWFFPCK